MSDTEEDTNTGYNTTVFNSTQRTGTSGKEILTYNNKSKESQGCEKTGNLEDTVVFNSVK